MRAPSPENFRIAWFCPIEVEQIAARAALEAQYEDSSEGYKVCHSLESDDNTYCFGRIGTYEIVLARPHGDGATNAAIATKDVMRSFGSIRYYLLAGVAGGVPYNEPGKPCVRLGDVVVGIEMKDHTGMIQFEYGRERLDGFRGTWNLKAPDIHLQRSALAIIRPFDGEESLERKAFRWHTQELLKRCPSDEYSWKRPDGAFEPLSGRYDTLPRLHGGLIASSSKVIQNALFRDDKVKEFQERGDILAFEMEGYAVAFRAQCLNIRGVCDYADESKNRMWQPYAAIVAAAFAKTVILGLPTSRSTSIVPIILPDLPGSTDLLQPLHARELPRNKMDARLRSIPESIPRIPVRFTFAEEPINPYNGEEKFLDNLSEGEFASKDGRSVFSEGSSISKDSQSPLLARRAKRARRAKSPGTAPQSTMHRRIRSLLSLSSGSDSEEDKREMALLRSDRRLRNYLEQCERDLELDYSMYLARTQERF